MIYVHIPFCRSFCTYCDFYSEVATRCSQTGIVEKFGQALSEEIRLRACDITDDINTLYIGGGTPSVLPLSFFDSLLKSLTEAGHSGPYDEFTVEVNPEDIMEKGENYVEGLLKLGANRISMGVQSFDDGILKFMNRRHDAATARKAYAILENAGVENISIDLIFGLPQLSDLQWEDTLKQALDISAKGNLPKHISSYQLSVEPGSMLAKLVEKDKWSEASEDLCEHQYGLLCEALSLAGYNHYEISNFSLPGYEAKHNSAYWAHVPYAGFGPGAHSYLLKQPDNAHIRQWNIPDLQAYISSPSSASEYETLTEDQLVLEHIMLALRTSAGISESYIQSHCDPHAVASALASGNLISLPDSRFRIPEGKFFISDAIISGLI